MQFYHHTSINFVAHNRAWSKDLFAHSSTHGHYFRNRSSSLLAVCLFSVAGNVVAVSRRLCLICYRLKKRVKGR
nr:hypothetical protein Iba_chr03aCG1540 [Ipomoea batatas]